MAKPQGVTIHRSDTGETVPCELVHEGVDGDGMDCWLIANAYFRIDIDTIHVEKMPGMTSLGFAASSRMTHLTIEDSEGTGGTFEIERKEPNEN